jgi:3',5'-nucleoside bisphosphate phosphatase
VKGFKADLHVHTALSPCAEDEMTPPAIVEAARARGIDMIAVCDHNSAGAVAAVMEAAGDGPAVLAGMELTTAEEIHVLGYFPGTAPALAAAGKLQVGLPPSRGPEGRFGRQLLLDAEGNLVGTESRMLAAASTFTLAEAIALIKDHGGLAVAAHVNRPSFSVLSQLGLFPREAGFDAVEVFLHPRSSPGLNRDHAYGLGVLHSSDAHFLADVGRRYTLLWMERPSFAELALALRGEAGRGIGHA